MKRGYDVLKLAELATQLKLPSSKGYKTRDYLGLVINKIEDSGYNFIQFLQLVDVLYVIIQEKEKVKGNITVDEEIQSHYEPYEKTSNLKRKDPIIEHQMKESVREVAEREPVTETPPEMEILQQRDHLKKSMKKNPLPWEK